MAYASRTYAAAGGGAQTFALTNTDGNAIGYIRESDIKVTVGTTVYTNAASGTNTYQFSGTSTLEQPSGGNIVLNASTTAAVTLARTTEIQSATVTYTAGSTLTSSDLNNADNQIRFGLQEFSDTYAAFLTGTGDFAALSGVIGGSETWTASDAFMATTSAIDTRVGTTIDTALTTDVSGGDGVTIVDNSPGAGQIRIDLDADIATLRNMQTGAATALALLTSTEIAILDGANLSTAELNYVKDVTSAIQTQLNAKQPLATDLTNLSSMQSGASTELASLTAAELEILDGATLTTTELNLLQGVPGTLTTAEIGYLDGVTSAIQTQLNAKQTLDADLTAIAALDKNDGNVIVGNGSTWVAENGATARTSLGAQAAAADLTNLSSCQTGGSAALAALTSTEVAILDGATPSTQQLNYVTGVTSAIQGQLDARQPLDAELTTLAGMTSNTASVLAGGTSLAATLAEINSICENRAAQTTITDDDAKIPTSGAVVDYVTGAVTAVGGFDTCASETTFPNTQLGAGVVLSIQDAGGMSISNAGVCSSPTTAGGTAVTITGIPNALYGGVGANPNPNVLAAGVGLQLLSSGSNQSYAYHKILATEADVAQLSGDINDFNERYRVSNGVPSGTDNPGDLYYDTGSDKMLVRNSANNAWEEVQSIGNFYIATLSPAFNGSLEDFTVSNAPSNAQQLIISINGVIQKPNAGTSRPSEGFALNGSTVLFSDPPATSSPYFAVVIGSNVNIGAPSNNTVGNNQLMSGAVDNAKVAANAAIAGSKIAPSFGSQHVNVAAGYSFQWGDTHERIEQSDGKIEFFTGNSEKMTLSGSDLGIGTASPAMPLHIKSNTPYIRFEDDNDNQDWQIEARAFFSIYDVTDSAHRLAIDGDGKVGIGTTTPTDSLQVKGGEIHFGDSNSSSSSIGKLSYVGNSGDLDIKAHSTGGNTTMKFTTSASGTPAERLRITSDGNVGIGVTGPGEKFDVVGNARANTFILRANGSAPTADASIFRAADNTLAFATSNTERLRIDSSGRVIIGATSVGTANTYSNNLVVSEAAGDAGISIHGNNSNSNYASLYLGDAGAASRAYLEATLGSNGNFTVGSNGTGAMRFVTNNGERFRIDSSGRILIGTTTGTSDPWGFHAHLQLNGDSTGAESTLSLARHSADTGAPVIVFGKSRAAGQADTTLVQAGDKLGSIYFVGADGTGWEPSALIEANVDGTPSDGTDMPGRLSFWTCADGSDQLAERVRITQGGELTQKATTQYTAPTAAFNINGGNATFADDAHIDLASIANTGAIVALGSQRNGSNSIVYANALFYVSYGTNTITELSDPQGIFAPSDSDGSVCLYKGTNTGTITVRNRIGHSNVLSVSVIRTSGL